MTHDPVRQAARYGWRHQQKRTRERGQQWGRACYRCGRAMVRGQSIHLDHLDGGGPNDYAGWSHKACNLRAGGRLGRARQLGRSVPAARPTTPTGRPSRDW